MITPARLDLPAKHRGRTARGEAVAIAGSVALWLGFALAITMVIAGWRPAALIAVVVALVLAGAVAVAIGRVRIRGEALDVIISRLLGR